MDKKKHPKTLGKMINLNNDGEHHTLIYANDITVTHLFNLFVKELPRLYRRALLSVI